MPERAVGSTVPAPDRASDAMIARCRDEVEGRVKALVRGLLLPWLRRRLRLAELGEGFQWGRGLTVGRGSRIGRYAYLGPGFASHGPVVVGDLCMFGTEPAAAIAELRLTLAILALYGVIAVQGSIFFAGFRAAQLFPVGAFWNAIVLLIENAALVVTVLLGGGIVAAATAWLLGRLVGLLSQNLLLRRRVPWLEIGLARGSWAEARSLMLPAGAVMLLPIAQALVLQGTALVVGAAAGQAAVPAFVAARTLSRVGMQLCWVVSTPLMPEFSAALARRDGPRMGTMILATLLLSGLLVIPYALAFMGLGQTAIGLWTHGAIDSSQALVVAFGFTVVFGGIWYPLSNLVMASDRQAGYTTWYLVLAFAYLPIAYGLAARYGAVGAAGAMAVLDLAMLVVVVRLARRVFGGRVDMAASLALLRQRMTSGAPFKRARAPR